MKLFSCKYLPLSAVLCGAAGFAIRMFLELFCIDEKGLYMTWHPLYISLFALTILALGWLLMTAYNAKPAIYQKQRFPSIVAFVGSILAAVGILVTDGYELIVSFQDFQFHRTAVSQSTLIVSALCFVVGILAAISLFLSGMLQHKGKRVHFLFYSVLAVYLMIHPLSQYRMWSSDPQLLNYGFHLLASVLLLLTAYHRAALDAGKPGFRRYVLFSQLALYFCCVSIQGESWLFYLTMALWLATNTGCLQAKEEI